MKLVALAIGPWQGFQPSERVVPESNGNRFSLSRGEGLPRAESRGRGEGGLQTKIELPFRIFRPALRQTDWKKSQAPTFREMIPGALRTRLNSQI